MSPAVRSILVSVAAVGVGAMIVTGAMRLVERQQTAEQINSLREDLFRARQGADRCRSSLESSEVALRELGLTIDSLKNRVDSFEAMDSRGVPAGRYEEYLEIFDSYNDSVEVWEARERRLRAADASCRATIEQHNALSDSLQQVLRDAGIEAG